MRSSKADSPLTQPWGKGKRLRVQSKPRVTRQYTSYPLNSRSGVLVVGHWFKNWLISMRMWVLSLASLTVLRLGIDASCSVSCRCGLDLVLLWLWCRPAAAALIQPLAWELPCATSVALKRKPKPKPKPKKKNKQTNQKTPEDQLWGTFGWEKCP